MVDVLQPGKLAGDGLQNDLTTPKLKSRNTAVVSRPDSSNQQATYPALRILEPGRKKLVSIETQRIIVCLDECIRRHELLASLLLIVIPNEKKLEEVSSTLGPDLLAAVKNHGELCGQLNDVLERNDDDDEHFAQVQQQVCESCKNLLRLFAANPVAAITVRNLLTDGGIVAGGRQLADARKMIDALVELRSIMFEFLLTTPTEEKDREKYLEKVTENEKNNAAVIEKLQAQLDAAIEDKEGEMSKRNDIIRRLKNDLHQIEQFSDEHIRRTKNEADKQQAADQRNSEGKQNKLQTDIEQLKDQYEKMLQENRETEQTLRKRKYKIETEVENWITKYDQDMGEKQDEYEQIDAVYTEEKKQLSELEEKFKVLEEEYSKIMEERRIAKEEREARELELAHKKKAAITIQAYFRAYKVRKALKTKSKGKGKGGKKKK